MDTLLYVGTYSQRGSEGIYVYRYEPKSGELRKEGAFDPGRNPSFLALHPRGHTLYSVSEVGEAGKGGAVCALARDGRSAALRPLGSASSGGSGPCHVSVHPTGAWVFVANYGSGSVAVLPADERGGVGEPAQVVQHPGPRVSRQRQEAPHAHQIVPDPTGRFVFVPDLGLNRVMQYCFDSASGRLRENQEPWVELRPGAGPRHFAFHPSLRFAYVINELDSTVSMFLYDAETGLLSYRQTVPALPPPQSVTSYCADIHVSGDGRFVYGSNRGHDSIALFSVEREQGVLKAEGHVPTQGKWPRNFALDPAGSFLHVANEHTDTIVTFRVDRSTGNLEPSGQVTFVPAPTCLLFAAAAAE